MLCLKTLVAVLLAVASLALGQWPEREVFLPDEFPGPPNPDIILYNPRNNTVFLAQHRARELLVIDANSGRRIGLTRLDGGITALCLDPDDNEVYALTGSGIHVLDAAAGRPLRRVPVSEYYEYDRAGYCPAARKLYCGNSENGSPLLAVDAAADTVLAYLPGIGPVDDLACHPGLNRLYVAAADLEGIVVVDCAADTVLGSFWTGTGEFLLAIYPERNRLYVAEAADEDVAVIHTGPDTLIKYIWAWSSAGGLQLDPARDRLYYSGTYDDELYIIDCRIDTVVERLSLPDGSRPGRLALDPGTDRLLIAGANALLFFDCAADTVLSLLPGSVTALAACPPTRRAFTAGGRPGEKAMISTVDLDEPAILDSLRPDFPPTTLALSPAGDRLYALDYNRDDIAVLDADVPGRRGIVANPEVATPFLPWPEPGRLYFAGRDSCLRAVDCTTDSIAFLGQLDFLPDIIAGSPAAGRLYLGRSGDERLRAYAVPGDTLATTIALPGPLYRVYTAPGSPRSHIYCGDPARLVVYDAAADSVVAVHPLPDVPYASAHIPGRGLVAASFPWDNSVLAFDEATGSLARWLTLPGRPGPLLHHPRLDRLYCQSDSPRSLTAIDCAGFTPAWTVNLPPDAKLAYLDPLADRLVVTGHNPPRADYLDCATGRMVAGLSLPGPPGPALLDVADRRAFFALPGRSSILAVRDTAQAGIALEPGPRSAPIPGATIVRGSLDLPVAGMTNDQWPMTLFDATGRKTMELQPGQNDVSRLAPGVYFIRTRGNVPVRRVLLVR